MTHELKTWTEYFSDVWDGIKTFELRKDDRGFKVGDSLLLKEWLPGDKRYTGREITKTVTHILNGGQFGLPEGYVIMSIQ